jgi:O-antigen ligase
VTGERSDPARPRLGALDVTWIATAILASLPLVLALGGAGGLRPWERVAAAAVVMLSVWRPHAGLLCLAGFAPIGPALAAAGHGVSAVHWLLPAALLGGAALVARRRVSLALLSPWFRASAVLLAWIALASLGVQILRDRVWYADHESWRADVVSFSGRDFFDRRERWRRQASGVALAEQVLLVPLVAAVVARKRVASTHLALGFTLGATAAAALSAVALGEKARAAGGGWGGLIAVVRHDQVWAPFPTYNSAGPFFALAVPVGVGLALACRHARHRVAAATLAGAVALQCGALVLTGSRIALAIVAPALASGFLLRRSGHRAAVVGATAVVAVVLTASMLVAAQGRRSWNDAPRAWMIRVELAKTTWGMLRDHPYAGVGTGNYWRASAGYMTRPVRAFYAHQNAHNDYLQIAGELGWPALAAFVFLLWQPVVRMGRSMWGGEAPAVGRAVWAGVLAFLLSCLGNHPLLVAEVAACFYVVLGILAGLASAEGPAPAARTARSVGRGVALAVILLAVTVPIRASTARHELDLEHVILGPGHWDEVDGSFQVRFRGRVAFYLPTATRRTEVLLRAARPRRTPVEVTVRVDDHEIGTYRLEGGRWTTVPIEMPAAERARFVLVRVGGRYEGRTTSVPVLLLRRPGRAPAPAP